MCKAARAIGPTAFMHCPTRDRFWLSSVIRLSSNLIRPLVIRRWHGPMPMDYSPPVAPGSRFESDAACPAPHDSDAHHAPNWKQLLLWAALAADASALLLAVTNHISQDIAAVPLLWIVPLSLYLLSLILCFENGRWYRRSFFLRLLAVALAGMTYSLAPEFANAGPSLQIPLFCIGLFVCCMVCHGELARLKPDPRHLASFYLMIAAGGAFGGIFVGVIAPRIFHDFYELPIALAGCAIVALVCLTPADSRLVATHSRRVLFFGGAAIVAIGFAFLPYLTAPQHRMSSDGAEFLWCSASAR